MLDLDTRTTGDHLTAGKLAGGELLVIPGTFYSIARRMIAAAQAGARAHATTHTDTVRAPIIDDIPTSHCPLWPGCGCPGGTMRPECPGLKSRIGVK